MPKNGFASARGCRFAPFLLVAALLSLSVLVGACGGSGGASQAEESLPPGWQRFSEGPYSGAIGPEWLATFIDISDLELPELSDEVMPVIEHAVTRLKMEGTASNVFFVFLDGGPDFATNINILPCEMDEGAEIVADVDRLIAHFREHGLAASRSGSVVYNGKELDLIRLEISPQFDSYQAYLKTGDCYSPATLTTRPGETRPIEQFEIFLSHLKIDSAQLLR